MRGESGENSAAETRGDMRHRVGGNGRTVGETWIKDT